jgi:predicted membrane protein
LCNFCLLWSFRVFTKTLYVLIGVNAAMYLEVFKGFTCMLLCVLWSFRVFTRALYALAYDFDNEVWFCMGLYLLWSSKVFFCIIPYVLPVHAPIVAVKFMGSKRLKEKRNHVGLTTSKWKNTKEGKKKYACENCFHANKVQVKL